MDIIKEMEKARRVMNAATEGLQALSPIMAQALVCTLIDTVAGMQGKTGAEWIEEITPLLQEVSGMFGVLEA